MAPAQDPVPKAGEAADLAQAYRDLTRGEQAAAALEANLSTLESKLDAMLEAFDTAEAVNGTTDDDKKGHQKEGKKDEADKGKGPAA